jgi:hypothetical protein
MSLIRKTTLVPLQNYTTRVITLGRRFLDAHVRRVHGEDLNSFLCHGFNPIFPQIIILPRRTPRSPIVGLAVIDIIFIVIISFH